jgi:hypothetical protein
VIEHTNFDSPANYDGKHIVFLSRYLPKPIRCGRWTMRPIWTSP